MQSCYPYPCQRRTKSHFSWISGFPCKAARLVQLEIKTHVYLSPVEMHPDIGCGQHPSKHLMFHCRFTFYTQLNEHLVIVNCNIVSSRGCSKRKTISLDFRIFRGRRSYQPQQLELFKDHCRHRDEPWKARVLEQLCRIQTTWQRRAFIPMLQHQHYPHHEQRLSQSIAAS